MSFRSLDLDEESEAIMCNFRPFAYMLVLIGPIYGCLEEYTIAADITWSGSYSNRWHYQMNWDPYTLLSYRVPTDGDTATLSDTTNGSEVTLGAWPAYYGDTDEIDGLTVENGFNMDTNGYLLHVSEYGTAVSTISGPDSTITVDELLADPNDRGFDSDYLWVENGGALVMNDGIADIDIRADVDSSSSIQGRGTVRFGTGAISSGDTVLVNNGTIQVDRTQPSATLTLEANNDGELDLDGTTGNGILDVDDTQFYPEKELTLVVDGPLSDSFSGTILIGRGDKVDFRQPWTAGNAHIEFNGLSSGVATLTGAQGTVNASRFEVNSGTAVIESDLMFNSGNCVVNASLQLDGNVAFDEAAELDLNGAAELIINATTEINSGTLSHFDLDGDSETNSIVINSGALLTLHAFAIDNDQGDSGLFNGTMDINGGTFVPDILLGFTFSYSAANPGLLDLNQGTISCTNLNLFGNLQVNGTAASTIEDSGIATFGDTLANPSLNVINADLNMEGNSLIRANAIFFGSGRLVNMPDRTMQIEDGADIDVTLWNQGEINLGNSPAEIVVDGFLQSSTGILNIEIGGTDPSEYDHVIVMNSTELNGEISVSLIDPLGGGSPFAPSAWETFEIIATLGDLQGEFSTKTFPAIPGKPGLEWLVEYDTIVDRVLLSVAPVFEADFDEDGDVDSDDLARWQAGYGAGTLHTQGDADGDLDVDGNDYLIWQRQFGSSLPMGGYASLSGSTDVAVPEPAAALLLILASVSICFCHRTAKRLCRSNSQVERNDRNIATTRYGSTLSR